MKFIPVHSYNNPEGPPYLLNMDKAISVQPMDHMRDGHKVNASIEFSGEEIYWVAETVAQIEEMLLAT